MSSGRFTAPGRTRSCPHCKATILESAAVCPGCHHHLRFDSAAARVQTDRTLRVDGVLRHPAGAEAWEYSIVLSVRNSRGEEVTRQVVGVGALQPAEERTFSLAVDVFKPAAAADPRPAAQTQTQAQAQAQPQAAPLAARSNAGQSAAASTAAGFTPGAPPAGAAAAASGPVPGLAPPGRQPLPGREPPRPSHGGTLTDPRPADSRLTDPRLQLKRR